MNKTSSFIIQFTLFFLFYDQIQLFYEQNKQIKIKNSMKR